MVAFDGAGTHRRMPGRLGVGQGLRGRNVVMVVDEVKGERGCDGSLVRKRWSDDVVVVVNAAKGPGWRF